MKIIPPLLLWLFLLPANSSAQAATDTPSGSRQMEYSFEQSLRRTQAEGAGKAAPKLDPKRIINESNGFLKEREPEMNAEEYAIYEKVVTLLETRPEFSVRMLETMMQGREAPSPAFQFILGNAYYSAGQLDKAAASYQSAIERYPTFLRAWSNLGILHYSAKNYPEAVRCLSKCVALGDREPATFGLLAYSLEAKGSIVPAEMAYLQALAGDPDNTDWLDGLLRLCIRNKQFDRAEAIIKDLLPQRPRESRYWLAYAQILMGANRRVEATAILEAALVTGVAGPDELNLLADLYAEQKLVPEAIAVYHRIRTDTPALGEQRMLNFARMLMANGSLDQARQVLAALRSGRTPGINVLQAEADLLVAQRQWPQAREKLAELLRHDPMNGPALLSLGRAYAAEEDLPRAALAFESASQTPDCLHRASLELATLELKNRHYDKAVQHLERALSLEKSDAVRELLSRVRPLAAPKTL